MVCFQMARKRFLLTKGLLSLWHQKVHYYNEISTSISAGLFLAAVQMAGLVTLTRCVITTIIFIINLHHNFYHNLNRSVPVWTIP